MNNEAKLRRSFSLQFFEGGDHRHHLFRSRRGSGPISKKTITKVFINCSVLTLDNLLAIENPRTEKNIQVLGLHVTAERCEIPNICHQKPARNFLNLSQRALHHLAFELLRDRNRLPERENLITNGYVIAVTETDRMMDPPLVQKGSVTTSEINQPKFTNILQVDESMPPRHLGRVQHYRVRRCSSQRTTVSDRIARTVDRF